MAYVLEATGIRKSYGGVAALRDCDFRVDAGTVHALLGENGAGKSTLVKILTGVVRQDRGEVVFEGERVRFRDANDAARHGVAVVSQELNLFQDLDVLGNLFMQRALLRAGLFDRRAMNEKARPVLEQLGLDVSTRRLVGELSLAEQQLVEIAKALLTDPRVLILDEPTSALDDAVSARLLHVLRVLRDRRVAVVFVSHILEEVMALSDVVTVLRDGTVAMREADREQITIDDIVTAMLGDQRAVIDQPAPPRRAPARSDDGRGGARLAVEGLTVAGRLKGVSMSARKGEIVGLAGVVGAGHLALMEAIAGVTKSAGGTVRLPDERSRAAGRPPRSLRRAVFRGIAVVSGDRKHGLLHDDSIWSNLAQVRSVALGQDGIFLRRPLLRARARKRILDLNIRTSGVEQAVGMLSGGNQQKVVMAKWLEASPSVLLLDDPTRGVAVGSKADIHRLLRESCDASVVLLCSTDLEELVSLCDRVLVFRRGQISAELSGENLTRHRLLTEMNAGAEAGAGPAGPALTGQQPLTEANTGSDG